jgi:hypothetical protein
VAEGEHAAPNPHRVGACGECGGYRADGRPPYLHYPGCSHEGELQLDRFFEEARTGDRGGPTLYCSNPAHDHGAPSERDIETIRRLGGSVQIDHVEG